mmetsp:Transcript_48210/g.55696  ORF Transcript_48210/g.55696 Transcript_48210/m.55696 type:complete len:259 (+) Transcript_48210:57-833(+)
MDGDPFAQTNHGWSLSTFANQNVPTYLPPEAIILEKGEFLKGFLLRCQVHDLQRMIDTDQCEAFVTQCSGDRLGKSALDQIQDRKTNVMEKLMELSKQHKEASAGAPMLASKGIVQIRKFKKEEMEQGAYGAILGARGSVHQDLEKSTGCKIVLAGKGITDLRKDTSDLAKAAAEEDPHARIWAPNHKALDECLKKIDWILSDEPAAQEFREKNRKTLAAFSGKVYIPIAQAQGAKSFDQPRKREREESTIDIDDFLS